MYISLAYDSFLLEEEPRIYEVTTIVLILRVIYLYEY